VKKRKTLKREANLQFIARYGLCVVVQFIYLLIAFAQTPILGLLGYGTFPAGVYTDFWGNIGALLGYLLLTALMSVLIGVIAIEMSYFHLCVFRDEKVSLRSFFASLFTDVGRKAAAHVWRLLFFIPWGMIGVVVLYLLFYVAGLNLNAITGSALVAMLVLCVPFVPLAVKALSYSAMPYILRDCPQVSVRKALRLSITLMKGRKGKLFVLLLSFFGWFLVSMAVAIGVVEIFFMGSEEATARTGLSVGSYIMNTVAGFYLWPYMAVAQAGFYHHLKRDYREKN